MMPLPAADAPHPAAFLLLPLLLLAGAAALADARLPPAAAAALPRVAVLLLDSAGHFAVGALSWAAATASAARPAALPHASALACGALASLLDLDHFLAARSLSVDGALGLRQRPAGHSLLFVAAVCGAIELLRWPAAAAAAAAAAKAARDVGERGGGGGGGGGSSAAGLLGALLGVEAVAVAPLVAVAWFSHLLRDATRRGFSLWPLPAPLAATPAISYPVYLVGLAALALGGRAVLAPTAAAAAAAARRAETFGGLSQYGAGL